LSTKTLKSIRIYDMSKLEVLELLQEILEGSTHKIRSKHDPDDFDTVLDYNSVMYKIANRISDEKQKPTYFDCTLEEHQEALYG
jgi:hypothetical protein